MRRELLHQLLRSKTFLVGAVIVVFWALCALLGGVLAPHDPLAQNLLAVNHAAGRRRTGSGPTSSAATCSRV